MGITAIMCVAIILLNRYLGNLIVGFKLELLYTMLIVLIGSLINMILLYLLKVKEFNYVYYMTANKIKQTIGTVLFD
jgi:putative peptidoglycan lipid II flippase